MNGSAFKSKDQEVLDAWQAYLDEAERVRLGREVLQERYGRQIWVNRSGFGHGTRISGFGRLLSDKEEDLSKAELPPELRYYKSTRLIQPNIRRKAGKDLESEMSKLATKGPGLPGMPDWTIVGSEGIAVIAPGIDLIDGTLYVFWGQDITGNSTQRGQVDLDLWRRVPLSEYYAAIESKEKVG